MKLVATKSFSYSTRRLKPGDVFEAKDPDGRLLVGVRKARYFGERKESFVPPPKKEILEKVQTENKPKAKSIDEAAAKDGKDGVESVNGVRTLEATEDAPKIPTGEDQKTEEAPAEKVAQTPVKPPVRRGRARKN